MVLSPYFAKPHEDRAFFEKDKKFNGDDMSPDVGRMTVEDRRSCRKSRASLGCDWLAGVFLSFSSFLFFALQRTPGVGAKRRSGCRHKWLYPVQSAICLNSERGNSKIGKEVP